MIPKKTHNFHIPVMGLAYTIDSPIRVAHLGIDSVISIVDDELIEKMNAFYTQKFSIPYNEITTKINDYRAKRITSYLNNVDRIVRRKYEAFCLELSTNKEALQSFTEILPNMCSIKKALEFYVSSQFNKSGEILNYLTKHFLPGTIDVNIMTKVDKANFSSNEQLPVVNNDAHASLRGFANSNLNSSVVLSAGMNPSLFNYIAEFSDFLPDEKGYFKKKVILKVSDFRSALIQGNFLAKKGVWVSEYRVESGLNCGGHAFATDGLLLGPIMEEFKQRRNELVSETYHLLEKSLLNKGITLSKPPEVKITVQGGVGTANEHEFLLSYYKADSIGWGSPFLLVPEATSTDVMTRNLLANAKEEDFYRSNISPLGVPFNSVKGTTNEDIKKNRILNDKAGSSCPKKLLALSREYDEKGICTASRKYQQIKLKELENIKEDILAIEYANKANDITVKSCLCVGLANPAYMENNIPIKGEEQGVVVCPGPNLAYFDREMSLKEMIRHIYGYESILAKVDRPNMFIKELGLYVDYLIKGIEECKSLLNTGLNKKWIVFKNNLLDGIVYYETIFKDNSFFLEQETIVMEKLKYFKTKVQMLDIDNEQIKIV